MATKLFVGGLAFSVTSDELEDFFKTAGKVVSAQVIMDKYSGRSKGFGFVEMGSEAEAAKAIAEFDGAELNGRAIGVNEAKPMEPRDSRGPSSGGYRGGGGDKRRSSNSSGGGRRY